MYIHCVLCCKSSVLSNKCSVQAVSCFFVCSVFLGGVQNYFRLLLCGKDPIGRVFKIGIKNETVFGVF